MMIKDSFIQDLEFYDKDNMPESVFSQLGAYYNDPEFHRDKVRKVSNEAATLCQWVRAVYEYAEISRAIKPKMQELLDAEEVLNKVN